MIPVELGSDTGGRDIGSCGLWVETDRVLPRRSGGPGAKIFLVSVIDGAEKAASCKA